MENIALQLAAAQRDPLRQHISEASGDMAPTVIIRHKTVYALRPDVRLVSREAVMRVFERVCGTGRVGSHLLRL